MFLFKGLYGTDEELLLERIGVLVVDFEGLSSLLDLLHLNYYSTTLSLFVQQLLQGLHLNVPLG